MALVGKGLRALTRIEYGNPAEQIVSVAEDERVETIVIGAQGATAAQELLIGSTAYEVIRRATVPVLLQKFEVILLNVHDERVTKQRPPKQMAEFDQIDAERLEKLCHTLKMFCLQARLVLRHGIPFKEALTVADEMYVSLIVLGWQGRSADREMLAGSTFENVARLSHQPVLVLRPQRS